MPRHGPAPKPTKLRIAEGNPGHRPLNAAEPQPTPGAPSVPAWLSREAKAEWRRLVGELGRLGLLTLVDRQALATCCQAWAELEDATRLLNKEGRETREPVLDKFGNHVGNKIRAHPAVRRQRDAMARVKQFLVEFGLSPSARARLRAPVTDAEADALKVFLEGQG